jgi:hypothetical protein
VGAYLAEARSIDALEGGPGLKSDLFGELLPLLLNNILIFADGHQQLINFVLCRLPQHFS